HAAEPNCKGSAEKKQRKDCPLDHVDHQAIRRSARAGLVHSIENFKVRVICETRETRLRHLERILTGLDKLATASVKPIEPKSKPGPNGSEDSRCTWMLFEDGGVRGNQEGRRDNKEVERLHSLGCVKGKPVPGMLAGLLGDLIGIGWRCHCHASARRPASVIVIRTTSNVRPPATMRSGVAVGSPPMHRCPLLPTGEPGARTLPSVAVSPGAG